MVNSEYYGLEKRKYIRTTYPDTNRPIFRTRGEELEIKDVSQGGLKFCTRGSIKIDGWVKGTMDFTDGTCIEVEGIVVRIKNKHMGLSFISDLEDYVYHQILPDQTFITSSP